MTLSLFSDYSLRVLMYAALKAGSFQLDEVAAAYGISRNHLAKVVHNLSKLGYLATRRGRGGGIELARPAEEVRIGALVRQTEGQAKIVECFDPATNSCRLGGGLQPESGAGRGDARVLRQPRSPHAARPGQWAASGRDAPRVAIDGRLRGSQGVTES